MESSVEFNKIIVIQSLSPSEPQTGTSLYNDVIRRWAELKFKYLQSELIDVHSKKQFFDAFSKLKNSMLAEGIAPYIHFEIHGREEGLVINNGEFVSWQELSPVLRGINVLVKNNLFISLATCYGFHILDTLDPMDRVPFFAYIGAPVELYNYEIEKDWNAYFDILLTSRDINAAIEALNKSNGKNEYKFMSSGFFLQRLKEKMNEMYLDRKSRRKKINDLRKMAKKQLGGLSPLSRHQTNILLQRELDGRPQLIEHMFDYFLMKSDVPPPKEYFQTSNL